MLRSILRALVKIMFQVVITLVYIAYKAEGINALLIFMPAQLIPSVLRKYGAQIGEGAEIHAPLIIHNASGESGKHYANLIIKDHVYLGRDIFFDLKEPITLDEYVTISMRCTLLTHTDVGNKPPEFITIPASRSPVHLKRGAYLGAGATVLEGVTIGERGVVAAGAVVIADVAEATIVGGVPAKFIKMVDAPAPDPVIEATRLS